MAKITTILFDCDNTLVLSEDLAFEACADLVNEILASRNIRSRFTGAQLQKDFVGQSFQNMMKSLKSQYKYEYQISDDELDDFATMEDDRVIIKLEEKLTPCAGITAELEQLLEAGSYHLSVVSGSALRRIQASLGKVGFDKYFRHNAIFSATNSLQNPTSKPDPAVYVHALEVLRKSPGECVAIEDSRSGVMAASRAGIKTIGYTGCYDDHEQEKMRMTLVECGCVVVMDHWKDFQTCLATIQSGEV
ncbi:6-phosphogluconate phosphatase [Lachnellula occidentalis]|uniref:6-phosphogluconate phosphatase n=1 Tax=Lachnellula occidentalis TaxID=215460 RepID=A0A8H8S8C8_9HELO|nr:6-phosphogluconate phosphatase [Lachnellula occidentalis]